MENFNGLFWLVPVASVTGLAFAYYFFKQMIVQQIQMEIQLIHIAFKHLIKEWGDEE